MYVTFNITNKKIDNLKSLKAISSLNQMYVDQTDDTFIKSEKINGKKDKDLSETDDYKRIGEIADKFKTIKVISPKFKKKVTINEEGYICSPLVDVQFKALIIYFIEQFEKVGVINKSEFSEVLVS